LFNLPAGGAEAKMPRFSETGEIAPPAVVILQQIGASATVVRPGRQAGD